MKNNVIGFEKNQANNQSDATITEAFSFFKNYLLYNGKAPSTANSYVTDIKSFLNFTKEFHKNKYRKVCDIDFLLVLEYSEHLSSLVMKQEMKGNTAERRLVSLKVFLQYIEDKHQVKNPISDHPLFKKGKYKKIELRLNDNTVDDYYVLSVYDSNKLMDTILSSNHFNKIRDYAIFQILLSTGCRRSELINLKWHNVDLDKKMLMIIRSKTSNSSKVKLTVSAIESLRNLFFSYGERPSGNDFIFKGKNNSNNHISDDAYSKTIKRWAKKAGLPDNVTGHSFRHFFITSLLEEGISPNEIIHYTGHTEAEGLKPYIHLSSFACTNIVDRLESRLNEHSSETDGTNAKKAV